MRAGLAVALVVLLIFSTCAMAGPKTPNWGDPDIVEGIKPRQSSPEESSYGELGLGINVGPFIVPVLIVHRQEQPSRCSRLLTESQAHAVIPIRRR